MLGGLVLWYQKHPAKPDTRHPRSPKILALSENQIEGIRLAKTGSEPIVLKRTAING